MLRVGERNLVRVCDRYIEFRVRQLKPFKHPLVGEGNWLVDAALLNASASTPGPSLRIRLLDRSFSPLESRPSAPFDYFDLPTFEFHSMRRAIKACAFKAPARAPARFIQFTYEGHERLFPLGEEDDRRAKKPRRKEDDESDENRRDGETFEIGDKKCCPDKFSTPEGAQPTRRRISGDKLIIHCKPWIIDATFKSESPCDCDCCEYRQEIKGPMKLVMVIDGKDVELSSPLPTSDYSPPEKPGEEPKPKKRDITKFEEDTIGLKETPGSPAAYGHRKDKGKPQFDTIDQDYPTSCSYWAADEPRWRIDKDMAGTGDSFLDVDWEFRGRLIDTCNGNAVALEKTWRWKTRQPV